MIFPLLPEAITSAQGQGHPRKTREGTAGLNDNIRRPLPSQSPFGVRIALRLGCDLELVVDIPDAGG